VFGQLLGFAAVALAQALEKNSRYLEIGLANFETGAAHDFVFQSMTAERDSSTDD
jgi:hypothetical protein